MVVIRLPPADQEAVAAVVTEARRVAAAWAGTPPEDRALALDGAAWALERAASELVELVVHEVGKPRAEAITEVDRAVAVLRYYAQQALDPDGDSLPGGDPATLLVARRRPRGVAGLITPWNFPVLLPVWKLAPALAFGNTAVLKPAPQASAVALRLAEALEVALPRGLLHVVAGGAETGAALVELADVISFTGSVVVGRAVATAAAGRGVPVQAGMGGHNPAVVLPDADVELAASIVAGAAMGFAGQKCTATGRVIVVGDPGPFTEALAAEVEKLVVGDPSEEATMVGPVVSAQARQRVLAAAAEAASAGGRVVTGGHPLDHPGFFVAPTVVDQLEPGATLATREVLGPVCGVLASRSPEEALALANAGEHGLVASVFTRDLDLALAFAAELEAGVVRVNAPSTGVDLVAPYGGLKASGFGPPELGKAARELYTATRTITLAPHRL